MHGGGFYGFERSMRHARREMKRAGEEMSRAGEEIHRAMHEAGESVSRAFDDDEPMTWRERKDARRKARRDARAARWEAKRARRARRHPTGPLGWAACYWWLIFPIVFAGPALVEELAAEMTGWGAGVVSGIEGLMHLSPAGPLAELIASGTSLTFNGAFLMLAAAAAVSAGAAIVALKAPRARPLV